MPEKLAVTSIALLLATPVFACGGSPSSTATGLPLSASGNVVHETVVRINNGARTVYQVDVPLEQVQAQLQLRQEMRHQTLAGKAVVNPVQNRAGENVGTVASAVQQDTTCDNNDLWISDAGDSTNCPSGNLLCYNAFDGHRGTLSPFDATYPGGGDWSTHVAVYSPGTETGNISFDTANGICWHVFEVTSMSGGGDAFSCHTAADTYSSSVTGHQNPNCTPYTDSPEVWVAYCPDGSC